MALPQKSLELAILTSKLTKNINKISVDVTEVLTFLPGPQIMSRHWKQRCDLTPCNSVGIRKASECYLIFGIQIMSSAFLSPASSYFFIFWRLSSFPVIFSTFQLFFNFLNSVFY